MIKIVLFAFITITILASCKNNPEPLNEDFYAIGYDRRGHEIIINDSLCFEVPILKFIVFLYHDSVFKVEIDHKKKQHFSLLKGTNQSKEALIPIFNSYRKTTLKSQLKHIQKHGIIHGCFSDGYFLFRTNEQLQFGLFDFMNYYDWKKHYPSNEIRLRPDQFPRIYQTIYHTFNSKWWDYYMSNEYHFKELRLHYFRPLKN